MESNGDLKSRDDIFITAPDQAVLSNAGKLAANAPSGDIGEVYLGIMKLVFTGRMLIKLKAITPYN